MAHDPRHGVGMSVLSGVENAGLVLDQWAESLADVLASMTDQRPDVQWQEGSGPLEHGDAETLWWEQPFQGAPDLAVWVGAPRPLWEHCGTITLKAAGLE